MPRAMLFALCALSLLAADKVKLSTRPSDLAQGRKLFEAQCARCHGPKGEGARGPMLAQPKLRRAADDAALVKILEDGIRGTEMNGADAMTPHEILLTAAYVRSLGRAPTAPVPGNAQHGAELYRARGCANCHSIHGEGGVSGPELATVGTRRSAAYLRQSLLNPSAAVPEDYLRVRIAPKSGAAVTGTRLNEDSFSIQIRDDAGAFHSFSKTDVSEIERQKGKSPMPSYQGQLSEPEITDLVAYLASLKEGQ